MKKLADSFSRGSLFNKKNPKEAMELPSVMVLSTQQYEEFCIIEKSITQISLEVEDKAKLAQVESSTSAAPCFVLISMPNSIPKRRNYSRLAL